MITPYHHDFSLLTPHNPNTNSPHHGSTSPPAELSPQLSSQQVPFRLPAADQQKGGAALEAELSQLNLTGSKPLVDGGW